MVRKAKLSADISEEGMDKLKEICSKYERSRGFMLERMIGKFHSEVFGEQKPKPKAKKKEMELPDGLNVDAWNLWIDYRKKIKKPLKTANQATNLINLGKTIEGQMAVVMQSINNEYQGLFEVKGNETNRPNQRIEDGLSTIQRRLQQARLERDSAQSGLSMGPNDGVVYEQVGEQKRIGCVEPVDGSNSKPF